MGSFPSMFLMPIKKGFPPGKTDLIYKEDVGKEEESTVKINYFNIFKAEPGKAVTAFYSAKKKSILFTKFDVDLLTQQGSSTKKQ